MSEVKSEKVVEKKSLIAQLEEEGDVAADYLEGLLDIADLDGDIDIDVENLTSKIESAFSFFNKSTQLDEKQVDEGLRKIRQALLESVCVCACAYVCVCVCVCMYVCKSN